MQVQLLRIANLHHVKDDDELHAVGRMTSGHRDLHEYLSFLHSDYQLLYQYITSIVQVVCTCCN
jgi:hypothetical protein